MISGMSTTATLLHFNELCVPQAVLPSPDTPPSLSLQLQLKLCLGGVSPVTQEGLSLLLFTDKIV